MKFSIKNFIDKYDQIQDFLRICSFAKEFLFGVVPVYVLNK